MHTTSTEFTTAVLEQLLDAPQVLLVAATQVEPAPTERAWVKVCADARYDAWLIAWGADSEIRAHDHGDSDAAIRVLHGSLLEWYRDPGDRATWTVRELASGHSVVVPRTRVHEVHNATDETALSLHVYAPPLTSMNPHTTVAQIGTGPALAGRTRARARSIA